MNIVLGKERCDKALCLEISALKGPKKVRHAGVGEINNGNKY